MLAIISIILLIAAIALLVIGILGQNEGLIKIGAPAVIILLILFIIQCLIIVDAGETGVQVVFGKVKDQTLKEGLNFKSPVVEVYIYSTRLKEYTMAENDSISARTKDNSQVSIDLTIQWSIDPEKVTSIYKNIARSEKDLQSLIMRPEIRSVTRDEAAQFSLEKLMVEREKFSAGMESKLSGSLGEKGILISQVLIRNINPPASVDASIQAKLKAEQDLLKKNFELEMAKKNAEIRKEEARGIAEAQEIIQKKLSPLYVQYEAIQAYKELANSQNTTFVIMPTSTEGAGMPLIIGN